MKRQFPIEVGSIVRSLAGRDEGRLFIVAEELDEDFVTVTDGSLRGLERRKKKRRRHLKPTGAVAEEFRIRMQAGEAVADHEVRLWLKREDI